MYIVIILGMHLLLATGFMRYFFHAPTKSFPIEHMETTIHTIAIGNDSRNNSG